jgi:NADPH:quinone reductase-like Zn-dependent oxidoreductase
MRAAVIVQQAAPGGSLASCVQVQEGFAEPAPPGPGQARVRTLCSALNHLDLWVIKGVPGLNLTYPRVSGSDACGTVEAVGPGVDAAWVGKRVIVNAAVAQPEPFRPLDPPAPMVPELHMLGEHHNGFHAELFNAPAANLQPVGEQHDPAEAAAFGLTFLTAYSMMLGKAHLRPGQWVLVTGIGGGVATAALAIARAWSCPTIVTSRHQWKLDRAHALGATHGVLDTGDDWSRQVRKLTGGRGVDLAVDSSGKATHLRCIKSLARGGAYVTPGCTSGPDATTDLARIFWNQLRIIGSTMGSNDEFAQLGALYRDGAFRPVVHSVVPAADAPRAFATLEAGEQFGKVVIDWR